MPGPGGRRLAYHKHRGGEDAAIHVAARRIKRRIRMSRRRHAARTRKVLASLAAKPESEIDFSDIPAMTERDWRGAERGKFYRPVKQQLTIRIDADVIAWLKSQGRGYQSRLNEISHAAIATRLPEVLRELFAK